MVAFFAGFSLILSCVEREAFYWASLLLWRLMMKYRFTAVESQNNQKRKFGYSVMKLKSIPVPLTSIWKGFILIVREPIQRSKLKSRKNRLIKVLTKNTVFNCFNMDTHSSFGVIDLLKDFQTQHMIIVEFRGLIVACGDSWLQHQRGARRATKQQIVSLCYVLDWLLVKMPFFVLLCRWMKTLILAVKPTIMLNSAMNSATEFPIG